jgi:hypothetical protein
VATMKARHPRVWHERQEIRERIISHG